MIIHRSERTGCRKKGEGHREKWKVLPYLSLEIGVSHCDPVAVTGRVEPRLAARLFVP